MKVIVSSDCHHIEPSLIGGLALLSAFLIVLRLLSVAYSVAAINARFEDYTLYARYRKNVISHNT